MIINHIILRHDLLEYAASLLTGGGGVRVDPHGSVAHHEPAAAPDRAVPLRRHPHLRRRGRARAGRRRGLAPPARHHPHHAQEQGPDHMQGQGERLSAVPQFAFGIEAEDSITDTPVQW